MDQNKHSELKQLLNNQEMLRQIARSPEARALAGMLAGAQDTAALEDMASQAVKGDTRQLSALVQQIARTPQGSELLRKLGASLEQ